MTQRFGRNQRRRAREALAEKDADLSRVTLSLMSAQQRADIAVGMAREKLEENTRLVRKNYRLSRILQDVQDMLPDYHAALPARGFEVRELEQRESYSMYIPLRFEPLMPESGIEAVGDALMNTVEVYSLMVGTTEDPMSECFHFRAEFDGLTLGYSLTKSTLKTWPRERVLREVAEMMAEGFTRELENKGWR